MSKKHIAARGANAGYWVNCAAKTQCRNSGLHVTNEEVAAVAKKLKKSVTRVNLEEVMASRVKPVIKEPQQRTLRLNSHTDLIPEIPADSAEIYQVNSALNHGVANPSLVEYDSFNEEDYYAQERRIMKIMMEDPRWVQAEQEATSVIDTLSVEDPMSRGEDEIVNDHGTFFLGECQPDLCDSNSQKIIQLFSACWAMGVSDDSSLKNAFSHATHNRFGMGQSDFKDQWGGDALYADHQTFFDLAVDSIYQNTQQNLTEDTYRLGRYTDPGELRPISSFTSEGKCLNEYVSEWWSLPAKTAVIIYSDVPKERVLGYYGAYLGTQYQAEFLVLGSGSQLPKLQNVEMVRQHEPPGYKGEKFKPELFKKPEKMVREPARSVASPRPLPPAPLPPSEGAVSGQESLERQEVPETPGFFARLFRRRTKK